MTRTDGLVRTRDGDLVPDPDLLAVATGGATSGNSLAGANPPGDDHHVCAAGWLDDVDGRPRPCPRCRPHLLPRAAGGGFTTRVDRADPAAVAPDLIRAITARRRAARQALASTRRPPRPMTTTPPNPASRTTRQEAPVTEQPTPTAAEAHATSHGGATTPWAALTAADAALVAEVLEHRAAQMHAETTAAAVALADPRRAAGDPRGRSVRLVQDLAHAAHLTEIAAQLRGQDGARGAGAA